MKIMDDHVFVDVDFNELLISESATDLNRGKAKEVYCFTKEQADEIVNRCRFKCAVYIVDNTYVIRRIEAYKARKRGAA